jgi:hypothetical protein
MNIKTITLLTPNGSKLAFAFACALVAGAGWGGKIGVDQVGSIYDRISDSFNYPSPTYLRIERSMMNSPALHAPPRLPTPPLPTNPAPAVPDDVFTNLHLTNV